MSSSLNYIEDYFNSQCSAEEKRQFEARCINDPAFASEVAVYITTRDVLRENLEEQKREKFAALYKELSSKRLNVIPLYKKRITYIAAACIIVLIICSVFLKTVSPRKLADDFIKQELATLPVTMGMEKDSLTLGIAAFNAHNYHLAEEIFYSLAEKDPADAELIENLGRTYLLSGQYDKAITTFDTLLSFPDLKVNKGKFYKAVSLLMRSYDKDVEVAKKLLEEVSKNNLPGSKKAAEWLNEL